MPEAHLSKEPPFPRGGTWFNGEIIPATLATGVFPGGWGLEGQQHIWQDSQTDSANAVTLQNAGGYGTGLPIVTRVVRNNATYNILPGQLVTFGTTDYYGNTVKYGTGVNGLAAVEAAYSFPADEYLPAAGVPPGDLFYVVTSGPCMLTTAKAPAAGNVNIAIGGVVVASTGSATTDGNEGAVIAQDTGASGDTSIFNQVQNRIGRALSATTTGQTATSILVAVGW